MSFFIYFKTYFLFMRGEHSCVRVKCKSHLCFVMLCCVLFVVFVAVWLIIYMLEAIR